MNLELAHEIVFQMGGMWEDIELGQIKRRMRK